MGQFQNVSYQDLNFTHLQFSVKTLSLKIALSVTNKANLGYKMEFWMSETILTKRRSKKIWKVWSEVALHATITLAVHKVFVMVVTLTQSAVLLYYGFASLSHSIEIHTTMI